MEDFSNFIDITYKTRDRQLLEDFLVGVTTPKERLEIANRIEIVKRLLADKPHHEIARDLHVGIATVTRGSRELSQGRFKILRSKP